jgi:hypothetical protein
MIAEDVEGIEFADPEIQKPHSKNPQGVKRRGKDVRK